MARKKAGRTLAQDVYDKLRTEILSGERRPGSSVQIKLVAESQEVSLGVVREAVTRLSSEGLIEATPQVGFSVRALSVDDLRDLTWTRVHLESLALRDSIERGDLAWEAEVLAAHHTLANTPTSLNGRLNPAWMAAHANFHAALVSACGSEHLLRIRHQLFDASELYRYWSTALSARNHRQRTVEVTDQHQHILDATLARDADRAAELMALHLNETATILATAAADAEMLPTTAD